MRCSLLAILALVTAASGCRVTLQREALERELREQEDRIYRLEDELAQYEAMLEAAREQNAELLRGSRDIYDAPREIIVPAPPRASGGSSSPRSSDGSRGSSNDASRDDSSSGGSSPRPMPPGERPTLEAVDPPPTIVVPPVDVQPPRAIEDPSARRIAPYAPPVIRPPDPRVPEAEAEPSAGQPTAPPEHRRYTPPPHPNAPSYELPPELRGPDYRVSQEPIKQTGHREPSVAPTNPFAGRRTARREPLPDDTNVPADQRVASLSLDRRLTGGLDFDGRRGDEGVAVVVELRNANGDVVNSPAAVSVVVIDPREPAETRRVARWDLQPTQTMATFRKSLLGHGAHLQLPWIARPPRSKQLELHVRAITPDGREFRAQRSIRVNLLPGVVESIAQPLPLPVAGSEVCPPCDVFECEEFCPTP